jgi:hypothetical protein
MNKPEQDNNSVLSPEDILDCIEHDLAVLDEILLSLEREAGELERISEQSTALALLIKAGDSDTLNEAINYFSSVLKQFAPVD